LAVVALAGAARADWQPGTFAKWVQMPDLSSMGLDVNATWQQGATGGGNFPFVKVLADDFPCKSTGPITDIHIWGSWLYNEMDPSATFKLSIHADVPKGVDVPYSHPGAELWSRVFEPTEYRVVPYETAPEQFYDPNTNQILGPDNQVLLYNFFIDPARAFKQEGTPEREMVYWLDVQVLTQPGLVFGWKTSPAQFGDDAVFADTQFFTGPPIGPAPAPVFWKDMFDPRTGESLNMAFAITPEPATLCLLGAGVAGLVARRIRRK
jgi:hypothetical protein